MDEIINQINNSFAGWTFDHMEPGTGKGEIILIFTNPPIVGDPLVYKRFTIKAVQAADVVFSKV